MPDLPYTADDLATATNAILKASGDHEDSETFARYALDALAAAGRLVDGDQRGRVQAVAELVVLADRLDADCAEHGVASAVSPGLRNAADVLTGESWLLKSFAPAGPAQPVLVPACDAEGIPLFIHGCGTVMPSSVSGVAKGEHYRYPPCSTPGPWRPLYVAAPTY